MDFNEYQEKARETAFYPELCKNLWYLALGLAGESGEVAEKVKKLYRDHNGILTDGYKDIIAKELGDVLWYVANVACEIGIPLEMIAIGNIMKLQSRKANGTLSGNGDNR